VRGSGSTNTTDYGVLASQKQVFDRCAVYSCYFLHGSAEDSHSLHSLAWKDAKTNKKRAEAFGAAEGHTHIGRDIRVVVFFPLESDWAKRRYFGHK